MKQTFREKALVFNSDSPQLSHSYEWINLWAQLRLQSQNEHVKQKVLWIAFFGIFLSSAPKFSSFCKFLVNQGESKYASLGFADVGLVSLWKCFAILDFVFLIWCTGVPIIESFYLGDSLAVASLFVVGKMLVMFLSLTFWRTDDLNESWFFC